MTAPAVVRRWNEPPPARVDRRASGPRGDADLAPGAGGATRVGGRIREQLIRIWRVAPLGAVLLTGLVAHVAVMPHLAVQGAAPDVLLAAVVAVAAGRGSRAGAGFGFAAGVGADVFLTTPLGTSALAYTLIGHVLGGASRGRPSGSAAAALCRPGSSCFDCRTGQHHDSGLETERAARPHRARRRAAARRAALRRAVVLTAVGVGTAHLATAVVATTVGGVPFLEPDGLVRIVGVAALSAPLGPLAGAAVRRLSQPSGGGG